MQSIRYLFLLFLSLFLAQETFSQNSATIRLNQIDYYPKCPKIAIAVNASSSSVTLLHAGTKKVVFTAALTPAVPWKYSNETASKADFSSFPQPGTYLL